MNINDLLKRLQDDNSLTVSQAGILADLQTGKIYSVHRELRFFLYLGILLIAAGAGFTVRQYFADRADLALVVALTLCWIGAFLYCFFKGGAFARGEVAPPHIAFDFILFFGCVFYALDVAYLETHFFILGEGWKNYLLVSAALFFFLAYRFDNRLVLSLALSSLAAWFGFTLSAHRIFALEEHYRLYAIIFALIALGAGALSHRLGVKKHFFDIYLNFAVHFLCLALISGVLERKLWSPYFPALILSCAACAFYAVSVRRFLYMLFALLYGYIGLSIVVVDGIHRETFFVFLYFMVTSAMMLLLIFAVSRKFKEKP